MIRDTEDSSSIEVINDKSLIGTDSRFKKLETTGTEQRFKLFVRKVTDKGDVMKIFLWCEIKICFYVDRNDLLEKLKCNYVGYSAIVGTTCLELMQLIKKKGRAEGSDFLFELNL